MKTSITLWKTFPGFDDTVIGRKQITILNMTMNSFANRRVRRAAAAR